MNASNINKGDILNVWVLMDDKPGHVNQILGLTKALSNYRDLTITKPPLVSFFKAIRMLLLNDCDSNTKSNPPDLIIGAGHQTHLSLLAFKKCYGGKAIVMMSPTFPHRFFDLCFIPRHDKPRKNQNIIETLGAINKVVPDAASQIKNTGLILLGGPSKHYKWDPKKVIDQIHKLVVGKPDIRWSVAGSRRTPKDTYDDIAVNFPKLKLVLPESVSAEWLPQEMLKSEQIWATADSVSMVYEALTSGAHTGVLELDYDKPTRITEEMERLISEGTTMSLENFDTTLSATSIYEADRCAKLLLEKFDL